MRIVTFNVRHALAPSGRVDTAVLADHCAWLDADLLALQEVDDGLRRSGRVDQAAAVARATGATELFGTARRAGWRGRYGNALLVRGAVVDAGTLHLPRLRWRERRSAVVATVEVGGRRLSVAATHLSTDHTEGVAQLAVLLDALAGRPPPRVVLGDLNLRPERAVPALEGAGYAVAPVADPTYPSSEPSLRIDHVAVQGLEVVRAVVLEAAPVSDHRPLLVEVR